jgi:4'-phosphopantetheinyl transferase
MNLTGLELVRRERQERIKEYRRQEDKARCLVAGLLLRAFCGVTHESPLRLGKNGKPYLWDSGVCFNLSHSGSYVVLGTASSEIGVDVEKVGPYPMDVAGRCFVPAELEWLRLQGAQDAFYRLWAAKESIMKATGKGFSLPPESFCVLPMDESAHFCAGGAWFLDWVHIDGHIICSAVGGTRQETEIERVSAMDLLAAKQ